jgi:phosphonate metabolism protein PhnN/1,5-bisphosphokinase (PRPP-forming)
MENQFITGLEALNYKMKKKIILIVGASGVGKDSLIKELKNEFEEKINFVTRCITRVPDKNENNYYFNSHAFNILKEQNFFVSTWQAHQNLYGISRDCVKDGVNIISISRGNINDFEKEYEEVYTINITLSKEELLKRLIKRGRENSEEIEKRLNRSYPKIIANTLIEFDNSREFIVSSNEFKNLIQTIIRK